jgi:hypothetical protein
MATMQSVERLVRQMLDVHPHKQARAIDETTLVDCIEACAECAEVCTSCADASLAEPSVADMVKSIRLCLDCAGICAVTAQVVTRQTDLDLDLCRAQVMACVTACRVCAVECERHARHHEHHRICAETCRRCDDACNRLLGAA